MKVTHDHQRLHAASKKAEVTLDGPCAIDPGKTGCRHEECLLLRISCALQLETAKTEEERQVIQQTTLCAAANIREDFEQSLN
jgi:hypothetical protein